MYRGREGWQIRTLHISVFKNGIVWGNELSGLRRGPGDSMRGQQGNITKIVWLCWGEAFKK